MELSRYFVTLQIFKSKYFMVVTNSAIDPCLSITKEDEEERPKRIFMNEIVKIIWRHSVDSQSQNPTALNLTNLTKTQNIKLHLY